MRLNEKFNAELNNKQSGFQSQLDHNNLFISIRLKCNKSLMKNTYNL